MMIEEGVKYAVSLIHMCMNVRGALSQSDKELRAWVGNIEHDGVKCKNVREVRQFLIEALAEGYEYIGPPECDNFDPKQGCMGHQDKETKPKFHTAMSENY